MKQGILRRLAWSAALCIAIGWIAGVLDFLLSVRIWIKGGIREWLLAFGHVTSYYSIIWFIILFSFSILIIFLSHTFKGQKRRRDYLFDTSSHILAGGSALYFYIFFLLRLNENYLPLARDTFSIVGNIFFLLACAMLYIILFLLLYRLSLWMKIFSFYSSLRYPAILLTAIAIAETAVLAITTPATWLTPERKVKPEPGVEPENINVLLITADALRPDHLSFNGYHRRTPNIDALSQESYIFDRAIAQSSWTFSSFISIMTSLYPEVISNCIPAPLDPARVTIAEVLSANGFNTGAILTNVNLINQFNLTQGFEYINHAYQQPSFIQNLVGSKIYDVAGRLSAKLFLSEDARILNHRALRWLRSNKDGRFFLWIHYMEPHLPHGEPWNDMLQSDREYTGHIGSTWGDITAIRKGEYNFDDRDLQHLIYLYDSDIQYMDYHLMELLDFLKKENLWDSTMIIFTADHGEEFMEHGQMNHGTSLHEELVHVPLLIKMPNQKVKRRIETHVQLLDLGPTILDAVGLPPLECMMGESLYPVIRGQEQEPRPAFSSCSFTNPELKSLRYDNYSLIYNLRKNSFRLYDLETDPLEMRDIHMEEKETAGRMLQMLKSYNEINLGLFNRIKRDWSDDKVYMSETEKQRMRALGYIK